MSKKLRPLGKRLYDVLPLDIIEHAVMHHAGVLGLIDQEFDRDRVEPSKAMNLVKAYFGYLVGRIVGMDAMKQPFGLASDVVTGRTEIVLDAVDVRADEVFVIRAKLTPERRHGLIESVRLVIARSGFVTGVAQRKIDRLVLREPNRRPPRT